MYWKTSNLEREMTVLYSSWKHIEPRVRCAAALFLVVYSRLPVIAQRNDGKGMVLSSIPQITATKSVSNVAYRMGVLKIMLPLSEDTPRWSNLQGSLRATISLVVDIFKSCIFRKTTLDAFLARRNPWPEMRLHSEVYFPWS
jgi:hypothetical protein